MSNLTDFAGVQSHLKHSNSTLPADDLPASWNYEAIVREVEATIAQIESGNLELADVFDQFAAALEQLRQCESFLATRQQQIDLLIETVADQPDF